MESSDTAAPNDQSMESDYGQWHWVFDIYLKENDIDQTRSRQSRSAKPVHSREH